MTNPATPKLLSIIRKIREERRSGDLTRLTDAELVAKLARALSNDNGDERLIACAVAVKWMASHARRDQRNGDLERALELLQEAGYSEAAYANLPPDHYLKAGQSREPWERYYDGHASGPHPWPLR